MAAQSFKCCSPALCVAPMSPHSFSHAQLLESDPAPSFFLSLGLQGKEQQGMEMEKGQLRAGAFPGCHVSATAETK